MPNSFFQFKEFRIDQDKTAMKVTTDACLFGAWVASKINGENILDIGAGTGLLSLMMAQALEKDLNHPSFKIDAIEIDSEAFDQLKGNFNRSPWSERMNPLHGNAISNQSMLSNYDVIVGNPPFYDNDLKSPEAKKNTAHHEGSLTLQNLQSLVTKLLDNKGQFYCLLPYRRKQEAMEMFNMGELVTVRPTPSHPPSRIMFMSKHSTSEIIEEEIIIKKNGAYTNDFINLLQPYYLNL